MGRDHLHLRAYDLRRLLQRHHPVRLPRPPRPTSERRAAEGGRYLFAEGLEKRRQEGTEGVGWGRRVVALRRGGAHRASAARRGSDAPTGTPLHPSYCSRALSQEPSQQGPDQRRRRPQPHGGAAVSVAGALAAAASDTATAAAVTPPATAGVGNEDSPLEHTPRTKLTRAHR